MSEQGISVEQARAHVQEGETALSQALKVIGMMIGTPDPDLEGIMDVAVANVNAMAQVATAHFSAAMAITNILLTDPPEGLDPLER